MNQQNLVMFKKKKTMKYFLSSKQHYSTGFINMKWKCCRYINLCVYLCLRQDHWYHYSQNMIQIQAGRFLLVTCCHKGLLRTQVVHSMLLKLSILYLIDVETQPGYKTLSSRYSLHQK